jgi:hypothetical protein
MKDNMDQELLDEIQNMTGFDTYRLWWVGKNKSKGYFCGKRYTRKRDAIRDLESVIGLKMYILVKVNSITGTTYEWI